MGIFSSSPQDEIPDVSDYNAVDNARDITIHCERGRIYLIIFDLDLLLLEPSKKIDSARKLADVETFHQLTRQWIALEREIGIISRRLNAVEVRNAMNIIFGSDQPYYTNKNIRHGSSYLDLVNDMRNAASARSDLPQLDENSSILFFADAATDDGKQSTAALVTEGFAVCGSKERLSKEFWSKWVDSPAMWPNHKHQSDEKDPIDFPYKKPTGDYSSEIKAYAFPGRHHFENVRASWTGTEGRGNGRVQTVVPSHVDLEGAEKVETVVHCIKTGHEFEEPVPLKQMVAILNDVWMDN